MTGKDRRKMTQIPPTDRAQGQGAPPFWRHPAGLLLAATGLAALAVPLAIWRAADPVTAHLGLGLFGMGGAAVMGYLAVAIRHWSGRGPMLPGPLLALTWALGQGLAVFRPDATPLWPALLALCALSICLPVLRAALKRRAAVVQLALSLAPLGLVLAQYALVSGWLAPGTAALMPALLILVVGGKALPALMVAEATRRGQPAGPPSLPRSPAVVALVLGMVLADQAGAACLVGSGLWACAMGIRMHGILPTPDPANRMLRLAWWTLSAALVARGAEVVEILPTPLGTHLLTMGAEGGMIYAIASRASMMRPAGQALAPTRRHWIGFCLVLLAAGLRMSAPFGTVFLTWAGIVWGLGWMAYLSVLLPSLLRPSPHPVFSARRPTGGFEPESHRLAADVGPASVP